MENKTIRWAQKLAALAQSGLTYSENPYEIERYQQIRQIAAEMMANKTGTDKQKITKLFTEQNGYATPKIDVRAAVFKDKKVLLVKERADGKWTLPGGYADVDDSPSNAVERETKEESGFDVKTIKLAALYDRNKHPHKPAFAFHLWKAFFICKITAGKPTPSYETPEVDFFSLNQLPLLSASRVLPRQIERMYQHHLDVSIPTDFD
jgi:ADP-ribose pyrophosphatase YjhB (NUDIX family)